MLCLMFGVILAFCIVTPFIILFGLPSLIAKRIAWPT